jgi:hypothetical protein
VIDISDKGFEDLENPMDEESGAQVIDLMEVFKRSLALSDQRTEEPVGQRGSGR